MTSQSGRATNCANSIVAIAIAMIVAFAAGCANEAIEANQRQVQQNQALIEETQKQIAQLQAQQNAAPPPTSSPMTPAGCDKTVMNAATRRGGDAYANGDLNKALGYYKDAVTACPGSAKANINVARTYEALGNREAAVRYYRAAASSKASEDAAVVQDAKAALSRFGVH